MPQRKEPLASVFRVAERGVSLGGGEGTAQAPWKPFLAAVSALATVGGLGLAGTAYVALRTSRGIRLDRAAADAVSSPALVLHWLGG